MSFAVAAEAYDRFMGRYSTPLAAPFVDYAGISVGHTVVDVGCGPGALTGELVERLGPEAVAAVDPSEPFVAAVRERYPAVAVQCAPAEELPFAANTFDAALAQLVVHFMTDPLAGLRDMARVTKPGGIVAACVWDHAGRHGPLSFFWEIARELEADVEDESELPGTREGHLEELFEAAGLDEVEGTAISVQVDHATFEDWWSPFTLGVGPAGAYVAGLTSERREDLRLRCRERLSEPIALSAVAWAARGHT